ncbi:MAG: PQQ-binding-like beta-propeller repeat protein [Brevundimonas sp.]
MSRASVQEVELVEGDEPEAPRTPVVRWRRWWFVPVLVALLAVGVQTSLDARARAQEARVAALPGTLESVGAALDVLWTVAPQDVPVVKADHEVNGALVGSRQADDGTYAALALDAATGRTRWSVPLDVSHARLNPRFGPGEPQCRPGGDLLYCMVDAPTGTDRAVLTIDATDGSIVRRIEVPAADQFAVDGAWTYLVRQKPRTSCDVSGVDGATVRWTTSVPCETGSLLVVGAGLVAVGDAGSEITVLDRTGAVHEREHGAWAWALGDAIVVATSDDRGAATSRLLRRGHPDIEVAGAVMVPRVDDGSASDVVVTTDRDTQGFDARTGKHLWTAPVSLAGSPIVRGGQIVDSGAGDAVLAIDAHSGRVHHRLAMRPDQHSQDPLTDGRRFLGLVRDGPSLPVRVLAFDVAGGGPVDQLQLPPGVIGVQQSGRRLLGIEASGTVRLLG